MKSWKVQPDSVAGHVNVANYDDNDDDDDDYNERDDNAANNYEKQ